MRIRGLLGISCLVISLMLPSCTTTEYVYVPDEPAELPRLEDTIDSELIAMVKRPLDVVMEPQTTTDLLRNMAEYKNGYHLFKGYSEALERYIDRIVSIHNGETEGVGYDIQG